MKNPLLWCFVPFAVLFLGAYAFLWWRDRRAINDAADEKALPEAPGPWLKVLNGGFVSLGLLFTFLGISWSISELGEAFRAGTVEALNRVMAPLGAKFLTSIIGLTLYLVTSFANAWLVKERGKRLAGFQEELDAAQDRARQAELDQAKAQARTMATQQRDLLKAITALQDTFRFDAQDPGPVQNMAMDLSRRLSDDLGAKLGEILTNTDAFARIQAQTQELMRSIQATTTSLNEATRGMTEESPRLIQQMNDASVQMNEAITAASRNLEKAAGTAAAEIGDSMAQFSAATRESIQGFATTVNTRIETSVAAAVGKELAQAIQHQLQVGQDLQAALLRRVDQGNERLAGTVSRLQEGLGQTLDGLNTSIQELEEQVGACGRDLGTHMARATDGLDQGIDRGIGHLTTAITDALTVVGRQTREDAQTIREAAVEVEEQAAQVRAAVSEARQAQVEVKADIGGLARTAEAFEARSDYMRAAFEASQEMLEGQAGDLRTIRFEVDALGSNIGAQARQLDQLQQDVAQVGQDQAAGQERLDAGIQGLADQAKAHAAEQERLDSGIQELADQAKAHAAGQERVDAGIQELASQAQDQARRMQTVQDGQEQALQQVKQVAEATESLKGELGTLRRLTHALSERVEQVFKALGDLASRLTGGWFGRREPEPAAEDEPAGVP